MFVRPSGNYRTHMLTAEKAMHSWSITITWDYHWLQLMYYDDMSMTGLSVEVFSCCYLFSCLYWAELPDREQTSNISLVIISGWSSFFFRAKHCPIRVGCRSSEFYDVWLVVTCLLQEEGLMPRAHRELNVSTLRPIIAQISLLFRYISCYQYINKERR